MKKQNIGLAMILLGIIFALYQELAAWLVGLFLGIAGLIVVIGSAKE